jgi:hypothetical protein
MRCRKARFKLSVNDRTDPELLKHLNECQSCAGLAQAQGIVDSAFNIIREQENPTPSDLAVIRSSLATRQSPKELSIMTKLTTAVTDHPRLGVGLAVGALALAFLILVPLPYQRVAGYDVQFLSVSKVIPGDQMGKALNSIGYGNIAVEVAAKQSGTDYKFASLPTLKAAKEVAAAFSALAATSVSPTITPRIETVSASLYAQARNKMIQIEVNGEGKTDEQIKAEIESKLAAQGYSGSLVYLKTDSTGKKEIKLQIEGSDSCPPGLSATTVEIDTHGKTDEQIKAEVESKLAAQGHPEAQVKISSSGVDSLRQVEIKIENCDPTKR